MGVVNGGAPREFVLELAAAANASVFVETGTFQGGTTRWAAEHFAVVHTIERSETLYERYHADLELNSNVRTHLGDSAKVLPAIVNSLSEEPAIYWLDGHWSGDETAGEGDECPLMEELRSLVTRPNDLILIDDARLFLCAPPKPHRPEQWPTLTEIFQVLSTGSKRFVQVIDDVIYLVPKTPAVVKTLIQHAQEQSASKSRRSKGKPFKRLVAKIGL